MKNETDKPTNRQTDKLKILLFLIWISLIVSTTLTGQTQYIDTSCSVQQNNTNQQSTTDCTSPTEANPCDCLGLSGSTLQADLDLFSPICFNVHIWLEESVVSDANFPYTYQQLNEAIIQLNHDFAIAKISFNLVEITELNVGEPFGNDPNAIDIRVENSIGGWGLASAGSFARLDINPFLYHRTLVGHEMGHVFGLAHSHGGGNAYNPEYWYTGGGTGDNPGGDCERVTYDANDPDNAICTGDFVADTNPVPNFSEEHRYELAEQLVNNGTFQTFELAYAHIGYHSGNYTPRKYLITDYSTNPATITYDVNNSPIAMGKNLQVSHKPMRLTLWHTPIGAYQATLPLVKLSECENLLI